MTPDPASGDTAQASTSRESTFRGGQNQGNREDGARYGVSLALSQVILAWERVTAAFWPFFTALFALFALALTGVLPSLPFWLHLLLLIASAALLAALAVRAVKRFALPSQVSARRRLERTNALEHRPLETLQDRPSRDDPIQAALWRRHLERTRARMGSLSLAVPEPQLARRDPFGLRLIAVFLFVLALASAGSDAPHRLADAVTPSYGGIAATAETVTVDAWLAPPEYTARPPRVLSSTVAAQEDVQGESSEPNVVETPDGSRLIIQVSGVGESLFLSTPEGRIPFDPFAPRAVAIEHTVTSTGTVTIESETETIAAWDIESIPDMGPEVTLPEDPVASLHHALTFIHTVSDDYAVATLTAIIERADRPAGSARSSVNETEIEVIQTPLPVPRSDKYGEVRRLFRDYTAHPWAGGPVLVTLVATDELGQEGRSRTAEVILPARDFNHPMAQMIVDLRRDLAWNPAQNYKDVAVVLNELAWSTELHGENVTVFLALREASNRLLSGPENEPPARDVVDAMVELLWKTALYLEDGGMSLALARLRAAEQALMDALAEGADVQTLDRLMDELQAAMHEYMQAMTEQLRQSMQDGEEVPRFDPEANGISRNDLDAMMDQMREMMQNGMTDSAQQMLENMRRMMENMQAGVQSQMSDDNRQAMDMLEDMQNLMEAQRELMDRTHQNAQEGEGREGEQSAGSQGNQGAEGDGQSGELGPHNTDALVQEALRRQLGEIMRQFGEMMETIPEPFGRADEGMSEAVDRLNDGDPRNALENQGEALDALQDAAQDARNAFMERFENQMGLGQQMPGQSGQQSIDPFGRQASEEYRGRAQGETEVPDAGGIERSRQVRDEIRRRAGQRNRPPAELDYIDRLLDQF